MSVLIPCGVFYGIAAVLIFRGFAERAAIRRSVNRILAHVMELSLFLDSPALVFGAQRALLLENGKLLRLVMLPGAILAVLSTPVYFFFRYDPLPVGEASVVTIQMRNRPMPNVELEAPEGIAVETPGVRILRDGQISWRVRPLRKTSGSWKFHVGNRVVTPGIFAHDAAIRSIDIPYPGATRMGVPMLVWFAGIASASAIVFGLLR
jgi:hypothetical protein